MSKLRLRLYNEYNLMFKNDDCETGDLEMVRSKIMKIYDLWDLRKVIFKKKYLFGLIRPIIFIWLGRQVITFPNFDLFFVFKENL